MGLMVRAWGIMYKEVVQSVLLYGSESWVVTGGMLKVLEVFHHRLSKRILGMTAHRTTGGEWEWTPVAEALKAAGILKIK